MIVLNEVGVWGAWPHHTAQGYIKYSPGELPKEINFQKELICNEMVL